MTDAKDVREARRIIETWREESPHLVQPEHWIPPIIALLDSFDTLTRERDEAVQDAARWRFYCCPQTALMLGSKCDPNDDSIDWRAEINRLADERIAALTQEDA
jgi:hypothetical protein